MFGVFESLTKAAVATVITPVAVVADLVTLGGSLNDKDQPYTADALEGIVENLSDAINPKK